MRVVKLLGESKQHNSLPEMLAPLVWYPWMPSRLGPTSLLPAYPHRGGYNHLHQIPNASSFGSGVGATGTAGAPISIPFGFIGRVSFFYFGASVALPFPFPVPRLALAPLPSF